VTKISAQHLPAVDTVHLQPKEEKEQDLLHQKEGRQCLLAEKPLLNL